MKKWEYKQIMTQGGLDHEVREAGMDGWELVSVCAFGAGYDMRYFFKRPLREKKII